MRIIDLYRYEQDGVVIVTPNKHNDSDKPSLYRVVADEGMLIKKGEIETCAIDTEHPEGWVEIVDENYIFHNDTAENWYEITDAEAEERKEAEDNGSYNLLV